MPEGYLADIYDGRVWREFHTADGLAFLEGKTTLGSLNVD